MTYDTNDLLAMMGLAGPSLRRRRFRFVPTVPNEPNQLRRLVRQVQASRRLRNRTRRRHEKLVVDATHIKAEIRHGVCPELNAR